MGIFASVMHKTDELLKFYEAQEAQYKKDHRDELKMFTPGAVVCDHPGEKMVHSSTTCSFQLSNGVTGYYTYEHSEVDGLWPAEETCYVRQEGDKLAAICKGSISEGHPLSKLKSIYDPNSKISTNFTGEDKSISEYKVFFFSSREELEKRMSEVCK